MDFSLSEEQQQLQELAHQIIGDQATNDHLKEIEKGAEQFDEKLWKDLAEAGLLGVGIAEEHGGMGFDYESLCLLAEIVGWHAAPLPVVAVLISAALPIQRFGNEEQRTRLLPGVASGETMLSAALIEPLNEDPRRPGTVAKRTEGGWTLSGTKSCVPFADRAERILVSAQIEGGIGVFLVDPTASGVQLSRQQTTAGEPQFEMVLNRAPVAAEDVLAASDVAPSVIHWIEQRTAAAVCIMAVGVVDRSTRMTAEYTAEREQFGVKIATFQAVGQRAANCYIDTECLRLVTQQAVSLLNAERAAEDELTIAKIWAGDVTHRVSHAAQHLHGGIGVDRDYPLFRYCLWAKQLELTLGSSAEMLARLGESVANEFRV